MDMSAGTTQHGYPSLAASEFVHRYIERRQLCSGPPIVTMPAIARSCPLLDFELGDPLRIQSCQTGFMRRAELAALVGLETHQKHRFLIGGAYHGFQIHFRPAALNRLFGLPMPELTDHNYAADAALGSKISDLRQRLGEASSFDQRIQLADAFVVGLAVGTATHSSIERAVSEIARSQGNCNINRVAHDTGCSMRNFQRRFRECVGIPPKLYARLVRFESVLQAKAASPSVSWMKVAHDAGYHDQMHMVHEFKEFTGGSPTAMFGDADQLLTPHADFKREADGRRQTLAHFY